MHEGAKRTLSDLATDPTVTRKELASLTRKALGGKSKAETEAAKTPAWERHLTTLRRQVEACDATLGTLRGLAKRKGNAQLSATLEAVIESQQAILLGLKDLEQKPDTVEGSNDKASNE